MSHKYRPSHFHAHTHKQTHTHTHTRSNSLVFYSERGSAKPLDLVDIFPFIFSQPVVAELPMHNPRYYSPPLMLCDRLMVCLRASSTRQPYQSLLPRPSPHPPPTTHTLPSLSPDLFTPQRLFFRDPGQRRVPWRGQAHRKPHSFRGRHRHTSAPVCV